jgi:hypothetical protein
MLLSKVASNLTRLQGECRTLYQRVIHQTTIKEAIQEDLSLR